MSAELGWRTARDFLSLQIAAPFKAERNTLGFPPPMTLRIFGRCSQVRLSFAKSIVSGRAANSSSGARLPRTVNQADWKAHELARKFFFDGKINKKLWPFRIQESLQSHMKLRARELPAVFPIWSRKIGPFLKTKNQSARRMSLC